MKKLLNILLLCAAFGFVFTSCSKDDDSETIKEQIIGTWDATEVQFDNDGKWIDITNRPSAAISITFERDGSYYSKGALGNGNGTYTVNGKTIKTYIDGDLIGTYVIKYISDTNAELSLTMGSETMDIRAKKSRINHASNDPSIMAYNGDINGNKCNKWWKCDRFEGNKLYRKIIHITDWLYHPENSIYTIIDDQVDNYDMSCYIISIEGKKYRALLLDSQTSESYTYSFDGKTLVLRNNDTFVETIYSASVCDNKLTISDGKTTEVYTKVSVN